MNQQHVISRRRFLNAASLGVGTVALAHLLNDGGLLPVDSAGAAHARPNDLRAWPGHFSGPARAMIVLTQVGGPSQMDLFDPKPELQKRDGQVHATKFESFQKGSESNKLMGSAFKFRPHGQCGMELSELLPHLGSVADELCLVRSMFGENNNHPQAMHFLNSGRVLAGRPTFGAWISYGLGSETQNLPVYVVLRDPRGYTDGGTTHWSNGWLPAQFRGTEIQSQGSAVLNLHPAVKVSEALRKNQLDAIARLNRLRQELYPNGSRSRNSALLCELVAQGERGGCH